MYIDKPAYTGKGNKRSFRFDSRSARKVTNGHNQYYMTSLICLLNLEILLLYVHPVQHSTISMGDTRIFFFSFFFIQIKKRGSQAFITHARPFRDSKICDILEKFVTVVKISLLLSSSLLCEGLPVSSVL